MSHPSPSTRPDRLRPLFSSATDLWETPLDLFQDLDAKFGFTLDVCALPTNTKCRKFFSPDEDSLKQRWTGTCWMNPPYGRTIGAWVKKAWESSKDGATVVCLLPSRTDTQWWHEYVAHASEIRYVRGRLRFGKAVNSAPFPSAVVVFRPRSIRWSTTLSVRPRSLFEGD